MPLSVEHGLKCLEDGIDKGEIAHLAGYKNSSSLDQFMRRRHYQWDVTVSRYVMTPRHPDYLASLPEYGGESSRVRQIIMELTSRNADVKDVARKTGFENYMDMAEYMRLKGYTWSTVQRNYVPLQARDQCEKTDKADLNELAQLAQYLPFLEQLYTNRHKVFGDSQRFSEIEEKNDIPRYVISGPTTVKSVHMSVRLSQLIRDVSEQTKISQKELVQIALVDFLRKYGFETEVHFLQPEHY